MSDQDREVNIKIRLTNDAATNNAVINTLKQQLVAALSQTSFKQLNPFGITETQLQALGVRLTTIGQQTAGRILQIQATGANQQAAIAQTGAARLTQITALSAAQQKLIAQQLAADQSTIQAKSQAAQIAAKIAFQNRQQLSAQAHAQRLTEIETRAASRPPSAGGLGVAAALSGAGAALSGAAILGIGREAVDSAVKLDTIKRALTAVAGSSEEAQKQLVRLREIAKLPGIGFEGAVQGSVRLQAVGFSAAEAERALKDFARAVALTGGGASELNSITVQLAQLSSKGKVLAQDLKPIIEAAPAVGKALKAAFGTVDSETIQKQLEASGKSAKDFINILLTEIEKLPQVTSGAKNTLENFSISVQLALSAVGGTILRTLTPALEAVGPVIERLGDRFAALPPGVQTTLLALGAAVPVFGTLLLGAGALVGGLGALSAAWLSLSAAVTGTGALVGVVATFTGALPVIAAVAGAVGIAALAFASYESSAERASKVTLAAVNEQAASILQIKTQADVIQGLVGVQELNTSQHQKLAEALALVDPATQSFIKSLSSEETQVRALSGALRQLAQDRQNDLEAKARDAGQALILAQQQLESQNEIAQSLKVQRLALEQAGGPFADIGRGLQPTNEALETLKRQLEDVEKRIAATKLERDRFAGTSQNLIGALGGTNLTLADQAKLLGATGDAANTALRGLGSFAEGMRGQVTPATEQATAAVGKFKAVIDGLKLAGVTPAIEKRISDAVEGAKTSLEAQKRLRELAAQDAEVRNARTQNIQQRSVTQGIQEFFNPNPRAGESEAKKLAKEFADARQALGRELSALQAQLAGIDFSSAVGRALQTLRDRFAKDLGDAALTVETLLPRIPKALRDLAQSVIETAQQINRSKLAEVIQRMKDFIGEVKPTQVPPGTIPSFEQYAAVLAQINELLPKQKDQTAEQRLELLLLSDTNKDLAGRLDIVNQLRERAARVDETRRITAADDAYKSLKDQLQGVLDAQLQLNDVQKLQRGADFGKLDPARQRELIGLASQADVNDAFKKQEEQARRTADKIGGFFESTFKDAFKRGPKAFLDHLRDEFENTIAKLGARLATSLLFKFLGVQAPGAAFAGLGNAQAAGAAGGGFNIGNIFGGGSSSSGIFGPLTPPFNPGASGRSGSGLLNLFGGGQGGGSGLLSKIPLLGKLFGGGGTSTLSAVKAGTAELPIGQGTSLSGILKSTAGILPGGAGDAASQAIGAASNAIPLVGPAIALGSLLGGLIGGKNLTSAGQIISHLGVAGGIIARLFFKDHTLDDLANLTRSEYGISFKGDKDKNEILPQVKQIGDQVFQGAGGTKKHLLDTIHLDQAKDIIRNYALGTGQDSKALGIVGGQLLTDQFSNANQFVRKFQLGGLVNGPTLGRDHIFAMLDGGEVVSRSETVGRLGPGSFAALDNGTATIAPTRGQDSARQMAVVLAKLEQMHAKISQAIEQNTKAIARLDSMSPGDVLTAGAKEAPHAIVKGVVDGLNNGGNEADAMRLKLLQ